MADYFTHFSRLFDFGTPENAEQALSLHAAPPDDEDDALEDGFVLSIDERSRLWIRDDASGDREQVIRFVRQCAATFGLTGGLQYANTCSRPRLDGLGGGAHVLDLATGETVAWTDTGGWLATALGGGDPDA